MIINLEDGELTPSPTEREPPVIKLRQQFSTSTTHLDDDPEIARLYQEALHTLPDTKIQREINHRTNGQVSHITSMNVNKKRKRKRTKNISLPNQNLPTFPDGTSYTKINSPGKRRRDLSANSNSNASQRNIKRLKPSNLNNFTGSRVIKKPVPPKMPSSLAAEVSRYFNTSKRMQYLFDVPPVTFVEGVGTFNAEDVFETVWDMTVNELQKLDKNCKELHMETIIVENMVQEQICIEKRSKRELIDAQGKYMKNVNYTDISSGHLRLPVKLSEAMMKHDCCVKILEELKEQYTLKFNKYQVTIGSFKKFTTFHKHLLEYKKMHDNFLLELDMYNQGIGGYNSQCQRNEIRYEDEEKSLDGSGESDFSDHSSDMSLCSRNSSFCPPPSPPLFNRESYSSNQLVNVLPSSNGCNLENGDNNQSNSTSLNNNIQKNIDDFQNNSLYLSPTLRCHTSGGINKQKDFDSLEKSVSNCTTTNLNGLNSLDNSIEEIPRPQPHAQLIPAPTLKDGNSSFARSGSWTNMQTYTKNNGITDESKRRSFVCPLPVNNCNNSWVPPPSNGHLLPNTQNDDSIESQGSLVKNKENGMTPVMVSKYNSSIKDISELQCYYDLFGQCKDNKCKSLHGIHKKVLVDCIDYCIRSEDIFNGLPKPNDETLAYFVFTVLRENNYSYNETINRLHNFVNNGYK